MSSSFPEVRDQKHDDNMAAWKRRGRHEAEGQRARGKGLELERFDDRRTAKSGDRGTECTTTDDRWRLPKALINQECPPRRTKFHGSCQ